MMVAVDDRRKGPAQVEKTIVLGIQFRQNVPRLDLTEKKSANELAQIPKPAIRAHQGGNLACRQNGLIQGQTRVPAEFQRPAGMPPGGHAGGSVERVHEKDGSGDPTLVCQVNDAARSFRTDAEVVGGDQQKACPVHGFS
jgi:hypothetical protein